MSDPGQDRAATVERIESLAVSISVRSIPMVLEPLLTTQLTIQQLKMLSIVVTERGAATARALADGFAISMATVSKLLDRLEQQRLIRRTADEDDSRVRRLEATELGNAVVARLMAARPELGADVLERMADADLRALERGLRAVDRAVRELRTPADG